MSVSDKMAFQLRDIASDPMWADHVEVKKKTLREAAEVIESLTTALRHIANGHPSAQQFAKRLLEI